MSLIDGQTEHGQLNSSSDHERLISEYNRLKHERESVNVEPRNKWLGYPLGLSGWSVEYLILTMSEIRNEKNRMKRMVKLDYAITQLNEKIEKLRGKNPSDPNIKLLENGLEVAYKEWGGLAISQDKDLTLSKPRNQKGAAQPAPVVPAEEAN